MEDIGDSNDSFLVAQNEKKVIVPKNHFARRTRENKIRIFRRRGVDQLFIYRIPISQIKSCKTTLTLNYKVN